MKVFVSWSKEPSKKIAEEVKHLVEMALPGTSVWMSEVDIGKGARWNVQVTNELEQTDVGIICCTENNLLEPWLHFEAGALSKSVEAGMVHPLCFGVDFDKLPGTLSQFQATKFDKADVLRLLHDINEISERKTKSTNVEAKFMRSWPGFEQAVTEELDKAVKASKPSANSALSTAQSTVSNPALSEDAQILLKVFAQSGHNLSVEDVAGVIKIHITRAQHYLNELSEKHYIVRSKVLIGGMPVTYSITRQGIAYAVDNSWV